MDHGMEIGYCDVDYSCFVVLHLDLVNLKLSIHRHGTVAGHDGSIDGHEQKIMAESRGKKNSQCQVWRGCLGAGRFDDVNGNVHIEE